MKANHICKGCGKEYYACDWCARVESYKRVACSTECYEVYAKQWLDDHPHIRLEQTNFLLPIRIGSTQQETEQHIQALMEIPVEEVEKETVEMLASEGYGNLVREAGIPAAVDVINQQLDQNRDKRAQDTKADKRRTRTKRRKTHD